MDLTQLCKDYGATFAAVVALVLGVGGDRIRRHVSRPVLHFGLSNEPPDCHMTTATFSGIARRGAALAFNTRQTGCYYLRIRVHNFGKSTAEDVEVVVTGAERLGASGTFEPWNDFLPLNLLWAHTREVAAPRIVAGVHRYCDLGHVLDPIERNTPPAGRAVLSLDVAVTCSGHPPARARHIQTQGRSDRLERGRCASRDKSGHYRELVSRWVTDATRSLT